ncbi:hypothetical protein GCK72_019481 [Caenorhabditis remanei]|uniref:Uncharacterized protein n=1 Tax=Caenorhabditis remanei TaxID=31234 RepID=E3LL15_CAERE|nr:hypothetical protein GCK72_019481 [Caenorhabditis remanei]EFP00174.1 hypothetical protein CRE_18999 [Caenorhabditis remanei]KAF1752926.1 hypothetical protein GCK72_019481 [Caenorhabditis remanei]
MTEETYEFITLTNENASELSEFLMSHFLLEEPLNRASGMTRQNFQPFVDKLFERTLNIPFSFALVEKESRKIAACAMSSLWKNEKNDHEGAGDSGNHGDEFTFGNEEKKEIGAIGKILTELHAKFFQLRPDIVQVLHLYVSNSSRFAISVIKFEFVIKHRSSNLVKYKITEYCS